ncbi:MAG: 6-phosphogluconolactonase, eukaryotic type [uncultured Rubrobacteraceae bacterium]|uniref:6-phosphogluconolactonase n=1 Tax=uncultured Rubrobacteraceae bacterium TaxID=349277 RepID=A0A6J4QSL7_9ACTN|nr:MAG: 6-phosphogluconolactonase, eukaryotic type [uncultured Rubrobacteraceae bacterium]
MNLCVYNDARELSEAAARMFVEEARRRINESGRFAVALAGGSTPKTTYEILAREYGGPEDLDWSKVHAFFGDERTVPPDHEDSNYRMAQEVLLSRVPVGSVHRIRGEMAPREAAALYEKELEEFFGGPPGLDLVLLGIGEDGHTASLFPRTPALDTRDRWTVENPVEKLNTTRLTLTVPAVNAARKVAFLVAGESKAEALEEILEGDADPHKYPAKLVRPEAEPAWMVDRAAARLLDGHQ